ncbi:MAG: hypothetical protein PHR45_07335 [Muribaculaceae bacterium]|nr:hypothetical protein [Muribaculaceae bacterium]
MKNFEETTKNMPYVETQEYIDNLIERCADRAQGGAENKNLGLLFRRVAIGSAAVAALFVGVFFTARLDEGDALAQVEESKSLEQVLSTMSNEQIDALTAYSLDEIPEY